MPGLTDIQMKAVKLLEMGPSPAAILRLQRIVLEVEPDREALEAGSRQVRILMDEQRSDGSWGPFHSRDTSSKQTIVTTETGVERALCLGLEQDHPVLARARDYILSIMRGRIRFPDHHEKNDRWPTGMRLFLASTLARIDPSHKILEQDRSLWREIATRTFRSGSYSEEDEIQAHASLTGASVRNSYLVLNNRYALNVLGSRRNLLPPAVEDSLLAWLWQHDRGIGYLDIPLGKTPPLTKAGPLDRWFSSLELLLRNFPRSARRLAVWIDWIWDQQDVDGLWDFGPRSPSSIFFPLADDWRRREQRRMDWSTRVLLLANTLELGRAVGSRQ
jgi:hypothetical protein